VKTQVALERLSPDALPVPPPPFATEALYQIFFGTPMGGVPSAPLPVTVPNDQDAAPGEQVTLWYYDAAPFPGVPAGWRQAGPATVSADGQTIVSDPGVVDLNADGWPDPITANESSSDVPILLHR
jgi:hypothetical protein